jgi:hypothetical protein
MIVKGSREREIHVNATTANKMVLLAFLCKHQERIQRPLLELTSVNEDMLEDIERQKQLEDQYKIEMATADPPSFPLDDANVPSPSMPFKRTSVEGEALRVSRCLTAPGTMHMSLQPTKTHHSVKIIQIIPLWTIR